MRLAVYSLFLLVWLSATSCNKKDELTRATENGANTFSCKLNGNIFRLADPAVRGARKTLITSFSEHDNHLLLQAFEPLREGYIEKRSIYFEFDDLKIGSQSFSAKNTAHIEFVVDGTLDQVEVFDANSEQNGFLNITRLDTAKNIISGTFSFTAPAKFILGKTLSVTEGRFDVKY